MIGMTDEMERDILLRLVAARRREMLRSRKCGAKTRKGTPCQMRPGPRGSRCRLHGGFSTGPKTTEGRRHIAEAQRRRWQRWREEKVRNVGKAAVFGPRNARG